MASLIVDYLHHKVYNPIRSMFLEQQRFLLLTLMIFVEIFSILLTGYSIYLSYLFYVPNHKNANKSKNTDLNWIGLSIVGFFLMTICVVGLRGAHLINLDLLLYFFWGIMVFIGPLIVAVVVGFDFLLYIELYFKHGWDTTTFNGIRTLFCNPSSSALHECKVPIQKVTAGQTSVDSWCMTKFGNTDCWNIYNNAFQQSKSVTEQVILAQTIVSVVNIGIILGTIYITYRILTPPVITESMNDVINYLLLLPVSGGFGLTWYMWDWEKYGQLGRVPYSYSGKLFLAMSICQLVALPWGIAAGRLKSQKLLTGYILFVILIGIGLAILGALGVIYSGLFSGKNYPFVRDNLVLIACDKTFTGCCCCGMTNTTEIKALSSTGDLCPEWKDEDIYQFLSLDLKLAGVSALISILYLTGAVIVALLVRISLRNYKSDYI